MVNKKLWFGILVIVLVFSLTIVGCDNGSMNNEPDPKKITITGITEMSGQIMVGLFSNYDESIVDVDNAVAKGKGTIDDGSVTVSLVTSDGVTPWTGNGSYLLVIGDGDGSSDYMYSAGKNPAEFGDSPPKYNITQVTSVVAFNQFSPF